VSTVITLQPDEYELVFKLVSWECERARRDVEHGRHAHHGMGEGTVQQYQREHYELALRCVVAVGEPKGRG